MAMTPEEEARARVFIHAVDWTYAKTVPQHPHLYVVRSSLPKRMAEEFDWFATLICQHGYRGTFAGSDFVYLDVAEFKYWISPTIDGTGLIVNRARRGGDAQLRLEMEGER